MIETPAGQLRVLHVVSGDLWAGAEAMAASLMEALERRPEVRIHAALMNPGELQQRLHRAGIGVTLLDENRLSPRQILSGLRRLVRARNPDLVHTHRVKENVLGSLAARLEGRRLSLRTMHGWDEHPPAWWRPDRQLIRALDRHAARRWQQAMVAVSDDLGGRLQDLYPGCAVEVIANGLDPLDYAAFRRRHQARMMSQPRIALVGRLVPVKRVDLFLRMAQALCADGGPEIAFDVLGDGPERAALEALAGEMGLAGRVQFHGFRDDVLNVLAAADLLVFTSDHEGTPMAALEALAIGVPVLARAVGGLPELLGGVDACVLVESDDPGSLARAVRVAIEAERAGQPAPWLPERYHAATCAAEYLRLYRTLLEERAQRLS